MMRLVIGTRAKQKLVRDRFWWLHLLHDVACYVMSGDSCQKMSSPAYARNLFSSVCSSCMVVSLTCSRWSLLDPFRIHIGEQGSVFLRRARHGLADRLSAAGCDRKHCVEFHRGVYLPILWCPTNQCQQQHKMLYAYLAGRIHEKERHGLADRLGPRSYAGRQGGADGGNEEEKHRSIGPRIWRLVGHGLVQGLFGICRRPF